MRWNGRQTNGRLVAPGRYTVTVVARDRAGNTSSRSAQVVVVG
jgi:flagellar hook assembly protein FlgD